MSITQTVEIPVNHKLTIDVPSEVPAGTVILTFTPKVETQERKKEREFGCAKGQFHMAEDFDAPSEAPAGPVILTFTPKEIPENGISSGFGCLKGQIKMSDDFDEPLEDFKNYM